MARFHENGFILLETLVAIVVVSVVLVTCIQSIAHIVTVSKKSEQVNMCAAAAQTMFFEICQNNVAEGYAEGDLYGCTWKATQETIRNDVSQYTLNIYGKEQQIQHTTTPSDMQCVTMIARQKTLTS